MKEDQRNLDTNGGNVRRHRSMQRLSRSNAGETQDDEDLLTVKKIRFKKKLRNKIIIIIIKLFILFIGIHGGARFRR